MNLDEKFWNQRYLDKETGWDLGEISAPLKKYFDQLENKALKIIRGLKDVNIVGFDLVEVNPAYDHAEITALAGATILLEYIYLLAHKKYQASL